MKIKISESQFRTLIIEQISNTDNILDTNELNVLLKKTKNNGYFATSTNNNIFDYIDKLPKGTYGIVNYDGYGYKQTQDGLWNELDSKDYQSSDKKPIKFAIYKKNKTPDGQERYYGIGIIFLQKDVTSDRQSEFDTTPPESHGGK